MNLRALAFCVSLTTTGCSSITIHGLEPTQPKTVISYINLNAHKPSTVDSLRPEIAWSPRGTHYDLIVYEAVMNFQVNGAPIATPGSEVLYEENLKEASYRFTKPLRPGKKYLWSVRTRADGQVSDWSSYDARVGIKYATAYRFLPNRYFLFETPKE